MKKIVSISYIRVLAMLMVVMLHSLCYYGNWGFTECVIASFQHFSSLLNDISMPVFFCISGYLFVKGVESRDRNTLSFYKDKFRRLIIPYLIWGGVQMLLIPDRYCLKQLFFGVSHLWFLLTLFWIFILMFSLKKYWSLFTVTQYIILIIVLIPFYHLSKLSHNFLRISSVIRFLPYFLIGIMIYKNLIVNSVFIRRIILGISAITLIIVKFYIGGIFNEYISFDLVRLLSLLMVYFLFDLLLRLNYNKSRSIEFLDGLSMGIYILHHIIIMFFLQFESVRLFLNTYWQIGPFLIFIVSLVSSCLLTLLLKNNKFTNIIIG